MVAVPRVIHHMQAFDMEKALARHRDIVNSFVNGSIDRESRPKELSSYLETVYILY